MDASFDQPDEDGAMDGAGGVAPPFGAQSQPIAIASSRRPSAAHSAPDHPFRHPVTAPASPAPYSLAMPTPKIYTTPSSPSPYSRQVAAVFQISHRSPTISNEQTFKTPKQKRHFFVQFLF